MIVSPLQLRHFASKLLAIIVAGCIGCFVFADDPPAKSEPKSIDGLWSGTLRLGVKDARLIVRIKTNADGELSGGIRNLDQSDREAMIDDIVLEGNQLRFEITKDKAVFLGTVSRNLTKIDGTWVYRGVSRPLSLVKVDTIPQPKRPQEPYPPFPYEALQISFENPRAQVKLAGVLTLPRTPAPHPAVVLISGSGPQDRDETVYGHRPFLVLADYLTQRGVAVLRFDDRGVGGSTGNTAVATSQDLADDVQAGVDFLKGTKGIDPARIGLIGHSEGGLIATLVAARTKDVACIVLLAAPGLPGEEFAYLQGESILRSAGASKAHIEHQRALQARVFSVLKTETEEAAIKRKVYQLFADEFQKADQNAKERMVDPVLAIQSQMGRLISPWFRFFLKHDPRPVLMQLECPVLALNGAKDVQVPAKENLAAIDEALRAAGNKRCQVTELPHLNHLFQTCKTGAMTEYSRIEETVAPAALEAIHGWIVKQIGKAREEK